MKQEFGFCTIVSWSHMKYAIALGIALQKFHPHHTLSVLLIDPPASLDAFARFPVDVISINEIGVRSLDEMRIYYDAFSLSNSLKPYFLHFLLKRKYEKGIYLDSDILVVGPFDELIEALENNSFVLTPHLLKPELSNQGVVEVAQIANLGIYNGGLWGVRDDKVGFAVIEWLIENLRETDGGFAEQQLLSLAAQLFQDRFYCLRNPGYNVAYWNLHERQIKTEGHRYVVNNAPATFFHLSGFEEDKPQCFSRHRNIRCDGSPVLQEIVNQYLSLIPNDPILDKRTYEFDYCAGKKLTPHLRRHYFKQRTFDGYRRGRIVDGIRKATLALKDTFLNG